MLTGKLDALQAGCIASAALSRHGLTMHGTLHSCASLKPSAAQISLRRRLSKSMLSCRSQTSESSCITLPHSIFLSLATHTKTHNPNILGARCDADNQHAEMPQSAYTAHYRCRALFYLPSCLVPLMACMTASICAHPKHIYTDPILRHLIAGIALPCFSPATDSEDHMLLISFCS